MGSSPAASLLTAFYFNSSLASEEFSSNGTFVRVAGPAGLTGDCLDISSGALEIASCNFSQNQTFYVSASRDKTSFSMFTSTLGAIYSPRTANNALILSANSQTQFCAYENDTGKLVVPPTMRTTRLLASQTTNLTLSFLKDTSLEPKVELRSPDSIRLMSSVTESEALTEGERNLLITLSDGFRKWFQHDQYVSINTDEISSMIIKCQENSKHADTARASQKPALLKLPPAAGLVARFTRLDHKTVSMLNKQGIGRFRSWSKSGIYEVRGEIMSTTMSLGNAPNSHVPFTMRDYVFVINSKSGRYIDAIASNAEREVVFAQRIAGKFKLLGKQELNGGEAAKSVNKNDEGPYAVY
ncbi:hypothetical protein LZ30DRAFT_689952 [Colletotrichum cereale]|nr:hypothetical protein LZ30DRAFT_689952 [Colletotrichum cereale]